MEIEIQEMCFVVLGRKKCDFPNFTTLSFTSNVDLSYFYKSNSFDYWIEKIIEFHVLLEFVDIFRYCSKYIHIHATGLHGICDYIIFTVF